MQNSLGEPERPEEASSQLTQLQPYKKERVALSLIGVTLLYYRHGDGSLTCRAVRGFSVAGEASGKDESQVREEAINDVRRNLYGR